MSRESVSYWRLVTCYSCYILYNVYLCLPFRAKYVNLHCIVVSSSLLWNQTLFGVISSIHEAKSLHRLLLVYYTGFCDPWLSQQRGKDTQDPVSISDTIFFVRSREISKLQDLYPIALKFDRHISSSAKSHSLKKYRHTREFTHQYLKNRCK